MIDSHSIGTGIQNEVHPRNGRESRSPVPLDFHGPDPLPHCLGRSRTTCAAMSDGFCH